MQISEFVEYMNYKIFPEMRENSPGSTYHISTKPRLGAHHDFQCRIPHEIGSKLVHIMKDDTKIYGISTDYIKALDKTKVTRETFKRIIAAG